MAGSNRSEKGLSSKLFGFTGASALLAALGWTFFSERSSVTNSQNVKACRPSQRMACSAATIPRSVVECETHVCFLHEAVIGANVFGPTIARYAPLVDLAFVRPPAKSASVKSTG